MTSVMHDLVRRFPRSLLLRLAILLISGGTVCGQTLPVPNSAVIQGTVKSGNSAIPGAAVTAINRATGEKVTTWTDLDGHYVLQVAGQGQYVVLAQMTAFASARGQAMLGNGNRSAKVDLDLMLMSRARQFFQERREATAAGGGGGGRGFQSLSVMQSEAGGDLESNDSQQVVPAGISVPGMTTTTATESVAVSGNNSAPDFSRMSTAEMQTRIQEYRAQHGGFGEGPPGGPRGGRPGGGRPMIMIGGGRGFNINRPHGMAYYTAGNSVLDAAPFSLTGAAVAKPSYAQNRYGVALGGPLNIPKIYHGGDKTFFFVNYNGSHSSNPFDQFSTVPTLLERGGDFSQTIIQSGPNAGQPVQIINPATGTPFPNNMIPQVNSSAAALLPFIPVPNLPGAVQNFHFLTSTTANSNDLNVRVNHALGPARMGPFRGRRGPRNNLNFGLHYHTADNVLTNPFPTLGGNTSVRSLDVPVGYVRSFGKLVNIVRVDFNRTRTSTTNLYANKRNVVGEAGITGVSQNPFDWGVPNLAFTSFAGTQDVSPLLRRDQTISASDFLIWNRGKHTFRFGGDFRRIQLNTETDSNVRGSFVFTGFYSGFDFADFLLGLPQQSSVQFGANNYHFRGNFWDLFAQDEWKLRGNLTLNLGVRYEYVSPFTEVNNRISNLIVSPTFNSTVPPVLVLPGQSGFPATLVRPDRNNFAPRLGIAWKPLRNTVVRAGYGINYNTTEYSSLAQQLGFQPPFAVAQTNTAIQCAPVQLTLQNGFPGNCGQSVSNNFAVDPNYRLGYVQIWNLDVQQEIRPTVVLNVDYTGTKGTRLDMVQAPNRTLAPNPLCSQNPFAVWCGVSPFNWETSQGDSVAHVGTVRLRKRLQAGVSLGGSYSFSKSIDDASSIGGGATAVAQNAFDTAAERGLSSFDQRHRFTADYLWELPFGHDKRWLNEAGILRGLLGDWQWSGDWTIASGTPFTPRVLGNFTDVNQGTNGTLRPDVTGLPVSVPNPSVAEWFNTAAFVAPPSGQFGDARRNSIIGPPTYLFDMALTKVFPLRESRVLEFQAQATNVFNTPQFTVIDTVVNSPSYGRVTNAGAMRAIQLSARFRF